jgi:hypothetical protein
MFNGRNILILGVLFLLTATINSCKEKNNDSVKANAFKSTVNKDTLQNQVWQMEEKYWDYVEKIDTVAYKKLWHEQFIGYPSFGNGVSKKSAIAAWIPELHKDTTLIFSFKLYKKAVNAIDDVVIVFYDADEIWTDKENKVVRKETFKFTHTWKKYDDTWVILGGMAAKKI